MWRTTVVLALFCATAAADTTVELRVDNSRIEASIVGTAKQTPLLLTDGDRSTEPMFIRSFQQGGPLALVFVIAGTEQAMGNDDFNGADPRQAGMLKPLVAAVDQLQLKSLLPPASTVEVITYDNKASVLVPWKPAEELVGSDMGTQHDYMMKVGSKLSDAVLLGFKDLEKRDEPHKLMIIIGDGSDADTKDASELFGRLKDMQRSKGVGLDIVALVVKHAQSPDEIQIDQLTDRAREVSYEQLETELKDAVAVATNRFEATFELSAFKHDGEQHTFRLMAGATELGHAQLKMPGTPAESKTWRWLVVLGVVGGFSLVSLLLFRTKASR